MHPNISPQSTQQAIVYGAKKKPGAGVTAAPFPNSAAREMFYLRKSICLNHIDIFDGCYHH